MCISTYPLKYFAWFHFIILITPFGLSFFSLLGFSYFAWLYISRWHAAWGNTFNYCSLYTRRKIYPQKIKIYHLKNKDLSSKNWEDIMGKCKHKSLALKKNKHVWPTHFHMRRCSQVLPVI